MSLERLYGLCVNFGRLYLHTDDYFCNWWTSLLYTSQNVFFLSFPLQHLSVSQRRNGHVPGTFYFIKFQPLNVTFSHFTKSHCKSIFCCPRVSRPMVPQLAPPKIPEGQKVDFDVSVILSVIYTLNKVPDQWNGSVFSVQKSCVWILFSKPRTNKISEGAQSSEILF